MRLTPMILKEISFQVTKGNPWWGLLLANEYLHPSDLLYQALQGQLRRRPDGAPRLGKLEAALQSGARAKQLSATQLAQIGTRTLQARRPVPARFRTPRDRANSFAPSRQRRAPCAYGAAARIAALPQ